MGLRTEAARSLAWRGLGAAEGHCVNSRDTAAYDEQPSLPRTVANSDTPSRKRASVANNTAL